jgi:DNA primase
MNCAEANQIDLVDYLNLLGYQPQKMRNNDHWYLSPFREEKEPSFKVHKAKNVWYDYGLGKGGKLINFVTEYYRCEVSEALKKISSFHGQKHQQNNTLRQPFHRHETNQINDDNARETAIKIIVAKQPITDLSLCSYLKKRRIEKSISDKYCYEVLFKLTDKEKEYKAIGFKNNAGGYELRNEYFKGGSSPKYISYIDNKADNICVFEGFFDFLSYQTIYQNQEQEMTNFLVLNSLSFFERSLLLLEKHTGVKLYLDNDNAGRKYTETALKRSLKFQDKSRLYKGYKDLNEWITNIGKANSQSQRFSRHP